MPTVRPQRSWEPLFGPLVSAWHPFCHSKFFENLRRSLPAEAGGANSVHRYRCRLRRDLKNGVSRCGLGRLGWKSAAVHPHRQAFGAKFGAQSPLLAAPKRQTRCFKRGALKNGSIWPLCGSPKWVNTIAFPMVFVHFREALGARPRCAHNDVGSHF